MDRREIGAWLVTPGTLPDLQPQQFRGEQLGLPAAGPGSLAGIGRRVVALAIDWLAALLVTGLLTELQYGSSEYGLTALGIFAVEVTVLTWLRGCSFGQRLTGLSVVRVDGARIGLLAAAARTLLVCLVVPPLVWDRDSRGLHDRAVGSACVIR